MTSYTKYFEKETSLLKDGFYCVAKEECLCNSLQEALAMLQKGTEYFVAAWMVNELKLGYYKQGEFTFADASGLEEKYLLELRVFNEQQELYVVKRGDGFMVRIISEGCGEKLNAVDSTSTIFGRFENRVNDRFVRLKENGRKISLIIPASADSEKYALTTRSYIVINEATGQAGYGYYRWVEISAEKGGN